MVALLIKFRLKLPRLDIFHNYFKYFRYISRLQEAGFLSEDNKTENFSNQNQYRYSLCLCPLIKELEMNTHSDSCLNLNKGPPEAGAYPDPICAHLKKPRPFPKPIEEFQWFLQVISHFFYLLIDIFILKRNIFKS